MKTTTETRATIAAMRPARMESAPRVGPTTSSSRYLIPAGSAPDRRTSARSCAACDDSGICNASVDARRGLDFVIQNDGKHLSDIVFRRLSHTLSTVGVQI